jgi:hypothetical protein
VEKIAKEIEELSKELDSDDQIIVQFTAIWSLLLEKGIISEEEYYNALLKATKDRVEEQK